MFDNDAAATVTLIAMAPCILFPLARTPAGLCAWAMIWVEGVFFFFVATSEGQLDYLLILVFRSTAHMVAYGVVAMIAMNMLRANEQIRPAIPILYITILSFGLLLIKPPFQAM